MIITCAVAGSSCAAIIIFVGLIMIFFLLPLNPNPKPYQPYKPGKPYKP